jgi:hypothetical protein
MRYPLSEFFFMTSWYWNAGNDVQRKQKKVQCTFIQAKRLFNVHLFDRLMYHESVILPLPRASLIQNLRLAILYNNIFIGKYYFNKAK